MKFFLIIFLSFFCLGLLAATSSQNAKKCVSPLEILSQTESLLRQEKFDEAEEKLSLLSLSSEENEKLNSKITSLKRQISLAKAKRAAKKKNWEEAQKELEIVLRLDPDNIAIARRLKEISQLRRQLEEFRARATRQKMETEIREGWTKNSAPIMGNEILPMTRKNNFDIQQKLHSIYLPEIEFHEAKIEDIALFLTTRSREFDPQKNGVAFLVQDEAKRGAKKISLSLREMPLYEILKYVAQLSSLKYRIEDQAVFIEPLQSVSQTLVTREFSVRQQFVLPQAKLKFSDEENEKPKTTRVISENISADTVKKVLESRGLVFQNPPSEKTLSDGSTCSPRADEYPTAMYSPSTGILTIRNTQEQIDFLEQLILNDSADQGMAKIIKIETRILEINQTDLEELGMNWTLNGGSLAVNSFNLPGGTSGTQVKLSGAAASTNLEGANALPRSGIDSLIGNNQNVSQNTFAIQGLLDGVTFQAVLNALEQKKSANLLSAPTILVNSGSGDAVIEVVKEFIYPTAFDPPQVKLYRKDRFGGDEAILDRVIVPSWPSEFKTPGRKIGVSIRVTKAQADHENKKVSLELKPKITDFDGFIDYGSPILQVENHIRVPVFTVRAFDEGFKLDIQDSHTMVLGGLIREEVQTIDDKVPVLGDIPFLGNLFRSKTERSVRKNLILFVTPRILQSNGSPINP